jgi:hypothetical protein
MILERKENFDLEAGGVRCFVIKGVSESPQVESTHKCFSWFDRAPPVSLRTDLRVEEGFPLGSITGGDMLALRLEQRLESIGFNVIAVSKVLHDTGDGTPIDLNPAAATIPS